MLRIILFGWLLAGPALLVHSELTELDGPNICKRRESYPVEVVYTELQSYQERGSNWCLTIPPRCSTYRIKNRVVNKTKTIMKNRIVRDCCDGYVSSGGECVPHCTDHCEHGRCIAPEKCKIRRRARTHNMDIEEDLDGMPPISIGTFGIPNDPELLDEYALYRPSIGTRRLLSERHREVYAEAFIEHERLGTLADLCVRALAKSQGTVHIAVPVREDPLKLRIHYDSIDVDLPLRECYFVEDVRYWRRVVLAKSTDKSLAQKKLSEYDWRGKGISIKYVEIVEACPAAFWPESEMAELAALVREHVRTMDIRHLQSLSEESFQRHKGSSDSEPDVTSEESEALFVSSDERNTSSEWTDEQEGECSEEQSTEQPDPKNQAKINFNRVETEEEQPAGEAKRVARGSRNAVRQQLRRLQAARKEAHEQRVHRRTVMRQRPAEQPEKKRRKSRKTVMGVFSMKVEPEPEDDEDKIVDRRNKEKVLERLRRYDFPSEHCHHIDLSFVRFFDNLVSFTLEFLGPHMGRDFHKRHLRFSTEDVVRLARGLQELDKLQIFRLRNSRMDHLKLHVLCRVLKNLKALEVIDSPVQPGLQMQAPFSGSHLPPFSQRHSSKQLAPKRPSGQTSANLAPV
ncbi:GL11877 [Drosophila persimilis]|uniref:GL11877 n=1 Tax=Drosophila persimilis TaxID=7234 RepID=B4HBW3_DROPE|nr:GL11877 [Drosophila persimilis]